MGNILIEPNLSVPKIVVKDINTDDENGANSVKNTWGVKFPLIEINGYLIPSGALRNFKLNYALNKIPSFSFEIEDSLYNFRRTITKKTIDKGVLFLGFPELYIKFSFVILNLPSDFGGDNIHLNGYFYNEKLYESEQKLYEDKSVSGILKELCADSGMGLFQTDNDKLTKQIPLVINPNMSRIKFFEDVVKRYTNSIYSIDGNGYIHIGNVEKLSIAEVDKYQWKNGLKLPNQLPLILSNRRKSEDSAEVNDEKLFINFFSIINNHGIEHITTSKIYNIFDDRGTEKEIKSLDFLGVGVTPLNTFSEFLDDYSGNKEFYEQIVGKDLSGKVIECDMEDICLEISPLSVINLELFLPKIEGVDQIIDTENSGKKIVIGISYEFEQSQDSYNRTPRTKQTLFLL